MGDAPTSLVPAGGAARKPRLLYATPTGGNPRPGYAAQLGAIRMTVKSFDHQPKDFMFTMGPVQMARSGIAEAAIKGGYDYVLMHDDDLVVDFEGGKLGNPIDLLHQAFADPKVGIAGAVYLREAPKVPTLTAWHPVHTSTAEDHPGEHMTVACGLPYGTFDVAGVGTGFMLIRVEALKAVMERTGREAFLFWPYRSVFGTNATLGEDYYFCWRMQQAGYRVLADSRLPTVHLKNSGALPFVWKDWEAADVECQACKSTGRIAAPPGIAWPHALPDGVPPPDHWPCSACFSTGRIPKKHEVTLELPHAEICKLPNGLQCIDVSGSRRPQEKAHVDRSDSPREHRVPAGSVGQHSDNGVPHHL